MTYLPVSRPATFRSITPDCCFFAWRLVTLLMTRVRSLSATLWLPAFPPGSGVGLAMTRGPLPGVPPAGFAVIWRGGDAAGAADTADPEAQAGSPNTAIITPPRE